MFGVISLMGYLFYTHIEQSAMKKSVTPLLLNITVDVFKERHNLTRISTEFRYPKSELII